jgi:anti-anti-sigma factor
VIRQEIPMQLETEIVGSEFLARIGERLVYSDNPAFHDMLDRMRASTATALVLDVAALEAVDSAGLGMFLIAKDAATKSNRDFRLRRPRGQVRTLLTFTRFDSLMTVEG